MERTAGGDLVEQIDRPPIDDLDMSVSRNPARITHNMYTTLAVPETRCGACSTKHLLQRSKSPLNESAHTKRNQVNT